MRAGPWDSPVVDEEPGPGRLQTGVTEWLTP
jgi:hypothetical protein